MPNTYFFLNVWINKKLNVLGPYLSMKDAVDILVDHMQGFIPLMADKKNWTYKAEVHEAVMSESGWQTINIPITENECYMKRKAL